MQPKMRPNPSSSPPMHDPRIDRVIDAINQLAKDIADLKTTGQEAAVPPPPLPTVPRPSQYVQWSFPNDQMSMEDSMAEDTVHASASVVPTFGQPANSSSPFAFCSPAPGGTSMFQFSGQRNPVTPQNPSPFQATGNLDFAGGGSFSLGKTGGGDKSDRKIIRVRRDKSRKR